MFQILKNNYIDVYCYSNNSKAVKYFPIDYAHNFIPQWWKNLPAKTHLDESQNSKENKRRSDLFTTMKKCPGFIEHYKRGIIIPLWEEIEFIINESGFQAHNASRNSNMFEFHNHKQYGGFLNYKNWIHVKIGSPWAIKTDKPINFVYTQPHYNFQDLNGKLFVPNSYDEYTIQHSTEIQMFVNVKNNDIINLSPGLPLVHKIPITEKKIKLHVEYDPQIYNKLKNQYNNTFFEGAWYNLKKHIRKKGL